MILKRAIITSWPSGIGTLKQVEMLFENITSQILDNCSPIKTNWNGMIHFQIIKSSDSADLLSNPIYTPGEYILKTAYIEVSLNVAKLEKLGLAEQRQTLSNIFKIGIKSMMGSEESLEMSYTDFENSCSELEDSKYRTSSKPKWNKYRTFQYYISDERNIEGPGILRLHYRLKSDVSFSEIIIENISLFYGYPSVSWISSSIIQCSFFYHKVRIDLQDQSIIKTEHYEDELDKQSRWW